LRSLLIAEARKQLAGSDLVKPQSSKIWQACGLSYSAFHRCFLDKEELFLTVFVCDMETLVNELNDIIRSQDSPYNIFVQIYSKVKKFQNSYLPIIAEACFDFNKVSHRETVTNQKKKLYDCIELFLNDKCTESALWTFFANPKVAAIYVTETILSSARNSALDSTLIYNMLFLSNGKKNQETANNEIPVPVKSVFEKLLPTVCVFEQTKSEIVCTFTGKTVTKMMGTTQRIFVTKPMIVFADRIHPEERQNFVSSVESCINNASCSNGSCRLYSIKDKAYFSVQFRMQQVTFQTNRKSCCCELTKTDKSKDNGTDRSQLRLYKASLKGAQLFVWEYDFTLDTVRIENGRSPKTITHIRSYVHRHSTEKSQQSFTRMFDSIIAGKTKATCEIKLISETNQDPLCFTISCTGVRRTDGVPERAFGFLQNTTKNCNLIKQYEKELLYMHENPQIGLMAVGHYNLSANTVVDFHQLSSEAVAVTEGMSYEQVFHLIEAKIFYYSDCIKYKKNFTRKNLILKFNAGETVFSFLYRRVSNEKTFVWTNMDFRLFKNNSSGDVECFMYGYDMTEKILRQQAAENFEAQGYELIGLIDLASRNATFYKFLQPDGILSYSYDVPDYEVHINTLVVQNVVPEEQKAAIESTSPKTIEEQLQKNKVYTHMFSINNKEKLINRKCLQFNYIDSERHLVFAYLSDKTAQYLEEQRKIEELNKAMLYAAKANESKSSFLSNMSHDMRTPLNGIIGFTELCLKTTDPVKLHHYLENVNVSGRLMLALVNDVLDLSKIESAKFELRLEVFDADKLFSEIIESIRYAAEEKKISLCIKAEGGSIGLVKADKLRCQQIILNLLSNAVKYTPNGGHVSCKVIREHFTDDSVLCQIIVKDNGIGMSESFLPHIWEPFSQEHAKEAGTVQGTGLGLSIVHRIVELMNGAIAVESKKGAGSKFTVTLPFLSVGQSKKRESSKQPPEMLFDFKGRHVLICEDNYLNAEIMSVLLSEKGIIVDHALNGKDGFELFSKSTPDEYDAIFMDVRMPVMDGLEATRKIRALLRPDAKSIPIIAMTANVFTEDMDSCISAGMNDFLSKPIDTRKLFGILSESLDRHN
jgi:signal transduction histidine kinase/CheY-like chemotaxis protein